MAEFITKHRSVAVIHYSRTTYEEYTHGKNQKIRENIN